MQEEDTLKEMEGFHMHKKIGIYMPARLNSERLPQKIILPFGESCLFDIACQKLDSISGDYNKYVLIYDEELIEIAKKYKNIKIIERDRGTVEVDGPLQYIFKDLKDVEDTHLMFLNPCLAFLTKETIEQSLRDFQNSDAEYATSIKPLQNWILDENKNCINYIDYQRLTTKEIEPCYQVAHCFHIFNKHNFFDDGLMLKNGFMPLAIPESETIDVDTKEDYDYAKWKWEK